MKPLILLPTFNVTQEKAERAVNSLCLQSTFSFNAVVAIDGCPKSLDVYRNICRANKLPFPLKILYREKRMKALGNIVKTLYAQDPLRISWVGIIDGDDYLYDIDAIRIMNDAYLSGASVAWSKFMWDGEPSELCNLIPPYVDPYKYPWVSSHFRTFKLDSFLSVPISNFLDSSGSFFPRCYDHALMLPQLYLCYINKSKTVFVDRFLYYYDNQDSSTPDDEHTQGSLEQSIALFIRKRGFLHR